ncbi:hypothetical protein GCM10025859_51840 [Alicyclobacillus fastidiosus]|nr:hypothetical protein GCM10025859_51840 [Alicyclobacillus fastidiosus]
MRYTNLSAQHEHEAMTYMRENNIKSVAKFERELERNVSKQCGDKCERPPLFGA